VSPARGATPTRGGLLRATRRLARVTKGVELLRRKREALVAELFRLARPAADARARIEAEAERAYPALWNALAVHGEAGLAPWSWPQRELSVEVVPGSVWGVAVSRLAERPPVARTLAARGTPATAGPGVLAAAARFETLADLLLDAAPREMLLRRLGDALARTSRQVNTLERRLAPGLAADIAGVRRALEEREREDHVRLKRLGARGGARLGIKNR
jgi:V/A-type H+-transporting ATPase subunit D